MGWGKGCRSIIIPPIQSLPINNHPTVNHKVENGACDKLAGRGKRGEGDVKGV